MPSAHFISWLLPCRNSLSLVSNRSILSKLKFNKVMKTSLTWCQNLNRRDHQLKKKFDIKLDSSCKFWFHHALLFSKLPLFSQHRFSLLFPLASTLSFSLLLLNPSNVFADNLRCLLSPILPTFSEHVCGFLSVSSEDILFNGEWIWRRQWNGHQPPLPSITWSRPFLPDWGGSFGSQVL